MFRRLYSFSARLCRSFTGRHTRYISTSGDPEPQPRYNVVVVGGGVMGISCAYFLASRMPHKSVCVFERDSTYTKASSMLSVASIRQQFSCIENILMSQYSVQFMKNIHQHLIVEGEQPVDVGLIERGYLFLTSEEGETVMRENHALQRELGVYVDLLNPSQLTEKFPWMCTEGINLASFGYKNEGWFDPWLLLSGFKSKAISLGVDFFPGEVTDINVVSDRVTSVKMKTSPENSKELEVHCDHLVNAAGPWAGEVALMAGIGKEDHTREILRAKLTVEPRLRSVFVFKCPNGPSNCPLVIDGHIYWRSERNDTYLTGYSPSEELDKAADGVTLEAEHHLFDDIIWPALAKRVPAFEELKVLRGWGGFYEYNTLDQNAIIGAHPIITNFIFVNGFSGHGIQMSPAAGRAVSEIILDGWSHSIDLTKLSFQRVLDHKPYREKCVV